MSDDKCAKVKKWTSLVLKNEDLIISDVNVEGQTGKGDGNSGEIHFVTVNGSTKSGTKKTLSLAVKSSMDNDNFSKDESISEAYRKEVYVYDVVKKTFEKFLKEKNLDPKIDIVPHCYGTLVNAETVCLVFENLRKRNFQLWDKTVALTHKHVELVLEAYGQWHGFAMALKDQKPEIFKDLMKANKNVFSNIFIRMKFDEIILKNLEDTKKLVFKENTECLKHLEFSQKDITSLTDVFFEDSDHHVILHGDCWTNNFLFQSSDGSTTNPSKVYILDWQCSGLGSPAIDLSHFIFACVDTEKYEPIELLKIYHDGLSKHLRFLGSDPAQVFPFEKLEEHWRRFSRFGMLLNCMMLRLTLLKKEDFPDIPAIAEQGNDLSEIFKIKGSYDPEFLRRIKNNYLFYCKNFQN